ncbi:MAG: AMP-dependent synthetase, partial [Myxococcales bacterium]
MALSEASTGRAITWNGLNELADSFARGLSSAGLVGGYRVLLAMTNRIEFVAAYLGTLRAGLIAVPVNPRSATGEMLRMITDSGARLVVADDTTITMVRAAVAGLGEAIAASEEGEGRHLVSPRIVTTSAVAEQGEWPWEEFLRHEGDVPVGRPDPEATAVLLYTSGTSGRPRAAMLSHRAMLANIDQTSRLDPPMIQGQDVVLGVLPLFHVYGLNAVLGQVMRRHARLVLVDQFDPEGVLDLIQDEAISVLPVAPVVFAHWMQTKGITDQLEPVRLVLSGSAPLAPELGSAFTARTGLPIYQGYGLTEASPVVTTTLSSSEPSPGSVGAALPGIEIKLVEESGLEPEGDDGGQIW